MTTHAHGPPPTNLTTHGRRRRLVAGLLALGAGGGLTWWLAARGVTWTAGVATLPFFILGVLGVLQAATGT